MRSKPQSLPNGIYALAGQVLNAGNVAHEFTHLDQQARDPGFWSSYVGQWAAILGAWGNTRAAHDLISYEIEANMNGYAAVNQTYSLPDFGWPVNLPFMFMVLFL